MSSAHCTGSESHLCGEAVRYRSDVATAHGFVVANIGAKVHCQSVGPSTWIMECEHAGKIWHRLESITRRHDRSWAGGTRNLTLRCTPAS